MLLLIFGLPGSGKSTLARAFAAQTGALHLSTDLIRREMHLLGHYQPEDKQKVYEVLFERARTALAQGKLVVVDSTLYKESIREPFRQMAAQSGAPLRWVEVRAHEPIIRQRLQHPRADSEADFAAYEKIRDAAEPFHEPCLILWSDLSSTDEMVDAVRHYLTHGALPAV